VGTITTTRWRRAFFQLFKRERIKRRIFTTHTEARAEVFDYIEMFDNPNDATVLAADLSPVQFEKRNAESGS
jgi:putative transposase